MTPFQIRDFLAQLIQVIIEGSSSQLTLVGMIVTLWAASSSGRIIVEGLQRIYGLSQREFPFWYIPLLSLVLMLCLGLTLLLATNLILFGEFFINTVTRWFHLPLNGVLLLQAGRWLIVIAGILTITAFTYALVLRPKSKKLAWHIAFPGAIFFLFVWLGLSELFSIYIDKMHLLNPVYGSLGALLILVTWLFYSAFIFFIGAEIVAWQAEKAHIL